MIGTDDMIQYSRYLLSMTHPKSKSEQLEEYAFYFDDLLKNDFKNFSEDKYIEALNYIKNIIYSNDNIINEVLEYAKYILNVFNNSRELRKYKLKKIILIQ